MQTREFAARLGGAGASAVTVRVAETELIVEPTADHPQIAVRFEDIAEVSAAGEELRVTLVKGEPLRLITPEAHDLDALVVDACRTLPELTHALRALGSSRSGTNSLRQREYFAPLLEARRRAEEAVSRRDIVGAFAVPRLLKAIEAQLAALAASYADPRPAAQRAFAAHVEYATEPLRDALRELERAAASAESPPADTRITAWRMWRDALARVFEVADLCWRALEGSVGPAPEAMSQPRTPRRPRRAG